MDTTDPLVDGIIYPEVRDRMILLKGTFTTIIM